MNDVMTKEQIIAKIAKETGISQRSMKKILDCLLDTVMEEVSKGNRVTFPGFGVFKTKRRAEWTGRNAQTGNVVTIPERIVPDFAPGTRFKEAVNNAGEEQVENDTD